MVFRPAFLAGAFVFWEKHAEETSYVSWVGVPSRGFCFLGKHAQEKSYVSRVVVPSRGFRFLGKTSPGNKLCLLGRRSQQGLLFSEKKDAQKKAMSLGSAFLAGVLLLLKKINACPGKIYVSRVGVPSRGFCFLRKVCTGKVYVSRVGVPSRGFCFLRKTCPEKRYVSRVVVPSRGFCFLRKTCPGKTLYVWDRIHWDRVDAFPLPRLKESGAAASRGTPPPLDSKPACCCED